jgi:hypothetical protein
MAVVERMQGDQREVLGVGELCGFVVRQLFAC